LASAIEKMADNPGVSDIFIDDKFGGVGKVASGCFPTVSDTHQGGPVGQFDLLL